jgi:hypothetical protein
VSPCKSPFPGEGDEPGATRTPAAAPCAPGPLTRLSLALLGHCGASASWETAGRLEKEAWDPEAGGAAKEPAGCQPPSVQSRRGPCGAPGSGITSPGRWQLLRRSSRSTKATGVLGRAAPSSPGCLKGRRPTSRSADWWTFPATGQWEACSQIEISIKGATALKLPRVDEGLSHLPEEAGHGLPRPSVHRFCDCKK